MGDVIQLGRVDAFGELLARLERTRTTVTRTPRGKLWTLNVKGTVRGTPTASLQDGVRARRVRRARAVSPVIPFRRYRLKAGAGIAPLRAALDRSSSARRVTTMQTAKPVVMQFERSRLTAEETERLRAAFGGLALVSMKIIDTVELVVVGRTCGVIVPVNIEDRHDGRPMRVVGPESFELHEVQNAADAAAIVRRALHKALTHEADECLRYADGGIVFDPHRRVT